MAKDLKEQDVLQSPHGHPEPDRAESLHNIIHPVKSGQDGIILGGAQRTAFTPDFHRGGERMDEKTSSARARQGDRVGILESIIS